MSSRPRTATRGWKSKQRRAKRIIARLLHKEAKLGLSEKESHELQYHLNQGN